MRIRRPENRSCSGYMQSCRRQMTGACTLISIAAPVGSVWDSEISYRPTRHHNVCMIITVTLLVANSRVLICREHLNIVFIGHVDAGKSTTGGQILYLTVSVIHHLHQACRGLVLQHEQSQACMSGKLRRISCCSGTKAAGLAKLGLSAASKGSLGARHPGLPCKPESHAHASNLLCTAAGRR